jgi:hypothetical protein
MPVAVYLQNGAITVQVTDDRPELSRCDCRTAQVKVQNPTTAATTKL